MVGKGSRSAYDIKVSVISSYIKFAGHDIVVTKCYISDIATTNAENNNKYQ